MKRFLSLLILGSIKFLLWPVTLEKPGFLPHLPVCNVWNRCDKKSQVYSSLGLFFTFKLLRNHAESTPRVYTQHSHFSASLPSFLVKKPSSFPWTTVPASAWCLVRAEEGSKWVSSRPQRLLPTWNLEFAFYCNQSMRLTYLKAFILCLQCIPGSLSWSWRCQKDQISSPTSFQTTDSLDTGHLSRSLIYFPQIGQMHPFQFLSPPSDMLFSLMSLWLLLSTQISLQWHRFTGASPWASICSNSFMCLLLTALFLFTRYQSLKSLC